MNMIFSTRPLLFVYNVMLVVSKKEKNKIKTVIINRYTSYLKTKILNVVPCTEFNERFGSVYNVNRCPSQLDYG